MKRMLSILMMSFAMFTMTISEAIPHHHHGDQVCYDIGHCCHKEREGSTHDADTHYGHSCGAEEANCHDTHSSDREKADSPDCGEDAKSHGSGCEHCGNKSCNAHIDIFLVPAAENKSIVCDDCGNDCGHADLLLFVNVIYSLVYPPTVTFYQPVRPDLTVPLPADFINYPFGLRAPPVA